MDAHSVDFAAWVSEKGPLWAFFLLWLFGCWRYVPPIIAAHLETQQLLRESLLRLAIAYESLAGEKLKPPLPLVDRQRWLPGDVGEP